MRKLRNILDGILRRLGCAMDKTPLWVRTLRQKWTNLPQVKLCDYGSNNQLIVGVGGHSKIQVMFASSGNKIEISSDSKISNLTVSICGSNNVIRLGERLQMDGGWLQIFGDNSTVELAPDCWMDNVFIYVTDSCASVSVGSRTMLGPRCELRCGDGHALYDISSGEIFNRAHHLRIGKNVWAGAGVLFLKDVTVGDGVVIGTRSVIIKHFPRSASPLASRQKLFETI
jgi:acetyltransferase-like isoleucine patch superfamily enzyme